MKEIIESMIYSHNPTQNPNLNTIKIEINTREIKTMNNDEDKPLLREIK